MSNGRNGPGKSPRGDRPACRTTPNWGRALFLRFLCIFAAKILFLFRVFRVFRGYNPFSRFFFGVILRNLRAKSFFGRDFRQIPATLWLCYRERNRISCLTKRCGGFPAG
jgi:hypothetical protein